MIKLFSIYRRHRVIYSGLALELCRQISVYPRQDLLQGRKEPLPPVVATLVGLLLIRPEARLLHAKVGPQSK